MGGRYKWSLSLPEVCISGSSLRYWSASCVFNWTLCIIWSPAPNHSLFISSLFHLRDIYFHVSATQYCSLGLCHLVAFHLLSSLNHCSQSCLDGELERWVLQSHCPTLISLKPNGSNIKLFNRLVVAHRSEHTSAPAPDHDHHRGNSGLSEITKQLLCMRSSLSSIISHPLQAVRSIK